VNGSFSSSREDGSEDEFLQAFEEYRAAYLAGSPPDRAAFLKRYPRIADELADAIDALYRLHPSPSIGSQADRNDPQFLRRDYSRERLGQYLLIQQIGRGAMGTVYEAEDVLINRRVALKLTHDALLSEADRKRFRREASIAASLHHTHIVPILHVGEDHGQFFYAMQLIVGGSLDQWLHGVSGRAVPFLSSLAAPLGSADAIDEEPPEVTGKPIASVTDAPDRESTATQSLRSDRPEEFARTVARTGIAIAEALEYAHQQGIKHYDVKPGNVLIDHRGHVWLTDFGLAQFQSRESGSNRFVGTVGYISPEMAGVLPGVVDHRSDIYSLGCLLYALATGQPPYVGSMQGYKLWLSVQEPISPRHRNPRFPTELNTIIMKAMARSVGDRYQTAEEVAADLRRFLEDRPIRALPPSLWTHIRKAVWRNRRLVTGMIATLIVCLTIFSATTYRLYRQSRVSEQKSQANERRYSDLVGKLFQNLNDQGWITDSTDPRAQYDRFRMITETLDDRIASGTATLKERYQAAQMHYYAAVQLSQLHEKPAEAKERLKRSAELFRAYSVETKDPLYRLDIIRSYNYLAAVLLGEGNPDGALAEQIKVNQEAEQLTREYPDDLRFADARVAYLISLAHANALAGHTDQARTEFLIARDLALQIPYNDPSKTHRNPWYFYAFNASNSEIYLAEMEAKLGHSAVARDLLSSAARRLDQIVLAAKDAGQDTLGYECVYPRMDLLNQLMLIDLGLDQEALAESERVTARAHEFERNHPGNTDLAKWTQDLQLSVARLRLQRGERDQALQSLKEANHWADQLPLAQAKLWVEAALEDFQDAPCALNLLEQQLLPDSPGDFARQQLYVCALVREKRYADALNYLKENPGPSAKNQYYALCYSKIQLCRILALVGTNELSQAQSAWAKLEPEVAKLRRSDRLELNELVEQVQKIMK